MTPEQKALALKMVRAGVFPSVALKKALQNRDVSPAPDRRWWRRLLT
jgi:hypothetical protein